MIDYCSDCMKQKFGRIRSDGQFRCISCQVKPNMLTRSRKKETKKRPPIFLIGAIAFVIVIAAQLLYKVLT